MKAAKNMLNPPLFRTARVVGMGGMIIFPTPALTADSALGLSKEFFERVELKGYISQGLQSIEADDGAFDPEDADMSFGFNRFLNALLIRGRIITG